MPGGVEMAYADGVLYDYTDYIGEEYTPNFYNLIKDDEFLKKAVTDDEGRIIRLGAKICGSEESDLTFTGPLIRKDYLEATGMDVPTTIDQWTALFQAMKDNGVEYPLAVHASGGNDLGPLFTTNMFSSAYGVAANDYYIKDDGTVAFGPYEDSYKDYLTLLNQWYEAGYINPDFTTQTENDIMSLDSSDRVGTAMTHLYTYGTTYYVTTESEDESKALIAAPAPVLNEGDTQAALRSSSRGLGDYKYITADCKNVEACIALLDALYLDDIDLELANGEEGVGYHLELAPNIRLIQDDNTQNSLLNGEASVAFLYTSQVTQVLAENPDLKVVYPEEGLGFGIMGAFIPSEAPNKAAANEFLNYILEPENAAKCMDYIGYYNTVKTADDLVNPDLVVPDSVTKGEIIQNVSAEADEAYNKNWTEFKAACGQ